MVGDHKGMTNRRRDAGVKPQRTQFIGKALRSLQAVCFVGRIGGDGLDAQELVIARQRRLKPRLLTGQNRVQHAG